MKKVIALIAIASALEWAPAPAQAHIFTPLRNWFSAGRSCIDTRAPAALAWDDLPPRACIASERRREGSAARANDAAFVSETIETPRKAAGLHRPNLERRGQSLRPEGQAWRVRARPICSKAGFENRALDFALDQS